MTGIAATVRTYAKPYAREFVLLAVLTCACLYAGSLSPYFWDITNLLDMTCHNIEVGLVALMMTLVITTGGIDLSVGSSVAMTGIVMAYAYQAGVPLPVAILAGLLASALGGLFNGLAIAAARIPPLIVTLGTFALYRGIPMAISKGQPVSEFPDWFLWIGQGKVGPVPMQLFLFVLMAILVAVVARLTPVGAYTDAVGTNPVAARFAGVPGPRLLVGLYTATGLMAGIAGIVLTSRVATAKADAASGFELDAIAAVVLGGTRITGGAGSLSGTVLGLLILAVLRYGLQLAGVASVWGIIVTGAILVITAALNEWLAVLARRMQAKRAAR